MEDKVPRVRRDLEFFPAQQAGKQFVLVRDQLGLVPEGTALPPELFELVTMLNGNTSIRDLQMYMMRKKGGVLVSREEVEGIISQLKQTYLLESQNYLRERERIIAEFSSTMVRSCAHRGVSYPAEMEQLATRLDDILSSATAPPRSPDARPMAVVAPHIDLSVGAKGYANAYKWLGGVEADCVVILGVGHQMREGLFCLTAKDFETPFGRVKTEKGVVERLRAVGGEALAPNDFPHRSEHSIEFQVLFLQHLSGPKKFSIVPILCGSPWHQLSPCNHQAFVSKARYFLKELSAIVNECADKILVVAGVDMSHIGPKFGHDAPAAYLKARAQEHDRTLLDALVRLDREAFWDEAIRVQDKYNVCGFMALASLLEILPPSKGLLLHYDMWFEAPTQSAVSFCAAGFIRN